MSGFRGAARQSSQRSNIFSAETALVLGIYLYVLLVPGALYGHRPDVRSVLLAAYGCMYMARLNMMARFLLPRELALEELTFVNLVWIPAILASFAIPSAACDTDIGLVPSVLSLGMYMAGSYLNARVCASTRVHPRPCISVCACV